jgi:hypothetical protein
MEKKNNIEQPKEIVLEFPIFEQPEREYVFKEIPPVIID